MRASDDEHTGAAALADRVGASTDRLVGTGNRLIAAIESAAAAQGRQQRAMIALTVVIAISALLYTVLTFQSVRAMNEANRLRAMEQSR